MEKPSIEAEIKQLIDKSITCKEIVPVSSGSLEHYKQELVTIKAELKVLNKQYKTDLKSMKFSEVINRQLLIHRKKQTESAICCMEMKGKQDRGEKILSGIVRLV